MHGNMIVLLSFLYKSSSSENIFRKFTNILFLLSPPLNWNKWITDLKKARHHLFLFSILKISYVNLEINKEYIIFLAILSYCYHVITWNCKKYGLMNTQNKKIINSREQKLLSLFVSFDGHPNWSCKWITSSYFLSASSAIHFASVNCFSSWSILSSLPQLRFSKTFLFLSAEYSIRINIKL